MNWSELNQTLGDEAGKAQREQDLSLQSFLASLIVSIAILSVATVVFVLLKNRYPRIYQPSRQSHSSIPPLPQGPLAWTLTIAKLSDKTIILERGLDAYLLLRLLRTAVVIFVPLAIILIPILVSLDVTATNDPISGKTSLNQLSWSNIQPKQQARYWVHLGACICVVGYLGLIITRESQVLARLRQSQLLHPNHRLPAGYVLITGIPKAWLSEGHLEEHLRQYYARFYREDTRIHVVRDYQHVIDKISHRNRLVGALEVAVTNRSKSSAHFHRTTFQDIRAWFPFLRRPEQAQFCHCSLTEILSMAKKIKQFNEQVDDALRSPSRFPLLPCAFLRFSDPVSAHIMCQVAHNDAPSHLVVHRIDAADNDQILWSNMGRQWRQRVWSRSVVTAVKILLAAFWALPISLTGFLTRLSDLASAFSWAKEVMLLPSELLVVLQGVLPQLVLTLLMTIFPYLLTFLIGQQAYLTRSAVELSLQFYYFIFLYLQVFLVVSISSAITVLVPSVLNDPKSTATILAQNLPQASNYFISYFLLFAFSQSAMQLTRVSDWIDRIPWPWLNRSPRARCTQASRQPMVQLGLILPVFTNLMCLGGIIFSTMAPLILACATFTFSLLWGVYRYLIIYVVDVPVDSGGILYWRALQQLLVGVYTLELCQIGLFALAGARGPLICMVFVMGGTVILHHRTETRMRPAVEYLPISIESHADRTTHTDDFKLENPYLSMSCPVARIPESNLSRLIMQYIPVSTTELT